MTFLKNLPNSLPNHDLLMYGFSTERRLDASFSFGFSFRVILCSSIGYSVGFNFCFGFVFSFGFGFSVGVCFCSGFSFGFCMKKSLASSFFPNIRDEMGEKTSHLIISYTTNTDGNILWVKITPKILIFQPISSSYFRKIWKI